MASFGPRDQTHCGDFPGGFTRLTPEVLDWVKFTSNVFDGSETKPHQFPWTVGLYILQDQKEALCGGSLITKKHVLTSAICVKGKTIDDIGVILGAHNIHESIRNLDLMVLSNISIYPDYDDLKNSPDIAVLQLENSVQFGPKIQPIRLPSQLMTGNLFEEKEAIVAGWNIIGPANSQYHDGKFTM